MSGVLDVLAAARARGADPEAVWAVLASGPAGADGDPRRFTGFTGAGLDRAVDERAEALRAAGVRAGRIHPFVAEADAAGVLDLLALWRLGATPAPLNARLAAGELEAARGALEGRDGGGAQVVLWTSGTSGAPRGVLLGAEGMVAHVEAVVRRLELDPARDVWLASLSPGHVGGLMLLFRALLSGSAVVAPGAVGPEALARLVAHGPELPGWSRPVTHLSLVPTQLRRLLERAGGSRAPAALRCVLLGGAHTPRNLLAWALEAGWPAALTWGMTEMASQVATAPPALVREKPGSVGPPLDGVQLRATPEGELLVRGPALAVGRLDGGPVADADGWYHTGDLGRVDADGHVHVTGRRADRIVSGGVTVEAAEVEEALRAHPAVREACVVGLPDPDWGETVAALVVPVEGEFDAEAVAAWLRDRLGPAKRPRRWATCDALPRNANGKVDRIAVRERVRAG